MNGVEMSVLTPHEPDRPIGRANRRPHALAGGVVAGVVSCSRAAGYARRWALPLAEVGAGRFEVG